MSESGKETGFTPGPWRVFTAPDGTMLIGIGEATGEGIFDCGFGVWRSGAEKLANARLAAAAPALYEALSELVELLDEVAPGYSHSTVAFAARSALLLSNTGGTGNG